MASLYQTQSSVGYRQNVSFKTITADELDVALLVVDNLEIGESIVPYTGGTATVGTTAKPFKSLNATSMTGTNGYFQGLKLLNTGATNFTALSYYEEYSNVLTYSGIWASSQTGTAKYTKVGSVVTINLDSFSATANTASLITSTAIPTQFRPVDTITNIVLTYNNGTSVISLATVGSNGVITLYNSTGNFTNSGTGGLQFDVTLTYTTS